MTTTYYLMMATSTEGRMTLKADNVILKSDKRADVENQLSKIRARVMDSAMYRVKRNEADYIAARKLPLNYVVECWIEEHRSSRPKQEG